MWMEHYLLQMWVSSGQVDSTIAQGLTLITQNSSNYYCWDAYNTVSFSGTPAELSENDIIYWSKVLMPCNQTTSLKFLYQLIQ